jgi:hypothetical protein
MTTKTSTIGLIELTSQTQANNGTQCFHDPIAKCDYISYESGYVRRKYSSRNYRGYVQNTIYQLNKKQEVLFNSPYHPGRVYYRIQRILEMDPDKRIDIVVRATTNYRKHLRKFTKN